MTVLPTASVTLRSILRLHPEHRTRWSGSIKMEGDEVLDMGSRALGDLRGRRVAMIFQEPATAFDPVFTVGHQIAETIRRHTGKSETDAWKRDRSTRFARHDGGADLRNGCGCMRGRLRRDRRPCRSRSDAGHELLSPVLPSRGSRRRRAAAPRMIA